MRPGGTGLQGAPESERYEILERVGRGGLGLVFRALDRRTGEEVAVKTLRTPGADALYWLKREFRVLADLVHPNLARLHDLEVGEGGAFFTMEFVRGVDFLAACGPECATRSEREERLRDALCQLADGLGALHARGKLHRDVKPSNVLVETQSGRVVLLDFGLVMETPGARPSRRSPAPAGTLASMAPEQVWGFELSPASDWFGVGTLLYECLTGRLPFGLAGAAVTLGETSSPPDPRVFCPDAPPDIAELALALLRPDPRERAGEAQVRACGRDPRRRASPRPPPCEVGARFVGRRVEQRRLVDAFERVRGGRAVVACVSGPSGIGKSALVERVLARLAGEGALALRSRCHPQEAVRFEAVDGLVDELSGHLRVAPISAALEPADVAALLRVFPVLGRVPLPEPAEDPLADAEPADIRRRAFGALRALLAGFTARRPTVLWIDDLQWGDADSAPLLRELLRTPGAPRALFVLSYRPDEEAARGLLGELEALRRDGEIESVAVELGPLSAEESAELARSLLDESGEANETLASRIAAEAEGSPIFVAQLARALARRDEPREAEASLGDVLRLRVEALPRQARELLETLSVAGGPLPRSVALEAAGLAPSGRGVVALLQQELLLRLVPAAGEPRLETHHDRIREALSERLSGETRRQLHGALLASFERAGEERPEVLLPHAEGSGDVARAAALAVEAGERARGALAFAQAAAFYDRALRLREWSPLDRRTLRIALGDCLLDAGRCAEAAPVYLEAASGAEREQELELRRLAAEQYLVSGRTEDGLRVLGPLLRELGLRLPESARGALVATAGRLLALALRGSRYRERSEAQLDARERTRIDVCFSAARGLIMSDTVRAGYLPLVGLGLALRAGEARRIGRSLAMVGGGVLQPFGGPLARWGERMLERCGAIAERTGDAYVAASASLARGQIGVMTGRWRMALDESERALAILRVSCRGVQWEKNVAHAAELRALDELGELGEADRRARLLAAEARELGDRYGGVVAALMLGISLVAADRPDDARRQLRAAFEGWSQERFLIQHLYSLRIEVLADLYEGRTLEAWARLEAAWPKIRESQFLRVAAPRIDAYGLRARATLALAASASSRDERARLVRSAAGDAKRLADEVRADARAHGQLLRACCASLSGDERGTLRALADAKRGFEEAEMQVWSRLCDGGKAALGSGIADDGAFAAICAPGLRLDARV